MKRNLLFLTFVFVALSGCVTSHLKDGKPYDMGDTASPNQGFAVKPAVVEPSKPKIDLVPQAGTPDKYDYKILEVIPGTPYAKAGIKANDILLSVDGRPVNTMDEIIKVAGIIDSGSYSQLVVKRNGQKFALRPKRK